MKKVIVSALCAAGMLGGASLPLISAAAVDIYVNVAPPTPRHEVVPAERRGYVWVPGHWQWNANRGRYYWTVGFWERARPGYVFRGPEWVQRDGRWHYQARRWEQGRGRDSDRDGIPDRRDATPYGGQRAQDSDRDGIPNRRDPTPYGGQRAPDRDRDGVPDHRDARPNDATRR